MRAAPLFTIAAIVSAAFGAPWWCYGALGVLAFLDTVTAGDGDRNPSLPFQLPAPPADDGDEAV